MLLHENEMSHVHPRLMRFLRTLLIALLVAPFCLHEISAQVNQRSLILSACENLFGKAIDPQDALFNVNDLFVLRPGFDSHGTLIEISVTPKYWFEQKHS